MAPSIVYGFDWPDRVVVGAIGQPGSRSFYLQARDGSRVISIALEKEQSAVLAEMIEGILDELQTAEGNPFSIPTSTPRELIDNEPLEQPVDPQFRTGAMSLGWDPSTSQVVIEAYPLVDSDDSEFEPTDAEPDEMMQVRIPVGTARAFAQRTREIVGAGRPICVLCGNPMDPEGHVCAPTDTL